MELLAAPVLEGERFQGKPVYFSDVIVRRDSPFQTFADLRGRSWAYNEPNSHSGYNVVRYRLAQIGGQRGYFGRAVQSGFHQRSLRMVAAGEIDASAIDCQVLQIELRDHPELAAQIRIIDALGPSPIQPVVANTRLPESLRGELRAVLLSMGHDPAARPMLARGFVAGFASVSERDYDPIREMTRLAQTVTL